MRGLPILALASALAAAAGGSALASPQFASTFDMAYSSRTPATSSGIGAHITWSDPGEPGGKPRAITRIRWDFNPGTRIDTAALPRCKATDAQIRRNGTRACPRNTRLGGGGTTVNQGTIAPFKTRVTLFNARRQIIVYVQTGDTTLALFRDTVGRSAITVNLKIPAGFSLTELRVGFRPHQRGRRAYFRTPASCPASGEWTTKVTFDYADGFSEQKTDTTPCSASSPIPY